MEKVGLVLQGGGMRGIYTAGVLDYFMEQNLYVPYVIAVSAGACNGAAYLARQHGLGKIMHTKYIHDPRYFNLANLLSKKPIFGMDFIFDEIPHKLEPFAFDRFQEATYIAPPEGSFIRGFERRKEKLHHYYNQGYEDARSSYASLQSWLNKIGDG